MIFEGHSKLSIYAVLQSLDHVSEMICHLTCVHHPAHADSFKAHLRQYYFRSVYGT